MERSQGLRRTGWARRIEACVWTLRVTCGWRPDAWGAGMTRIIRLLFTGLIALSVAFSSACTGCHHSSGTTEAGTPGVALTAGPFLEVKNYSPAGRAANGAVEFSLPTFSVANTLGAHTAPTGKVFLVIDTIWKNIIPLTKVSKHSDNQDSTNGAGGVGFGAGQAQEKENPDDYEMKPTPYVIPAVKDHAFVVINGQDTAVISDAQTAAAHPLPTDEIVIAKLNDEVRGQLVYEIPASGVSSVLFRFLDTSMGSFDVQIYGKPPAEGPAIAGPVANDVLEMKAYGVQELVQAGGKTAPSGQKYAVVQLGFTGKAEGALVRLELANYASLHDSQGFAYPAAQDVSLPGQFQGMVQFLPKTPQRGLLAFQVPEQHGALTVVVTLPGYAPLELNLPNTGSGNAAAPKPPAVLFTIPDGDTLDVQVHEVHTAGSLGSTQPDDGKRFVVLDLTLVNKADQGIEFQTEEQLKLLNGDEEILVDANSMGGLPHGLIENSVVPAHAQGRFEVAYQVPVAVTKLTLYYRGFNREEKHPLALK